MKRTPPSLKARAMQWLAQREHSRAEMQRKLLPHARALAAQALAADGTAGSAASDEAAPEPGAVMSSVTEVLDWLEAGNYLSQQRFTESRIHVRAARHGNLRIRQELAQHGITLNGEADEALKASEFGRAREVWGRKFAAPAADAAGRARQARFLTSRGFSPETVRRVLRSAGSASDED